MNFPLLWFAFCITGCLFFCFLKELQFLKMLSVSLLFQHTGPKWKRTWIPGSLSAEHLVSLFPVMISKAKLEENFANGGQSFRMRRRQNDRNRDHCDTCSMHLNIGLRTLWKGELHFSVGYQSVLTNKHCVQWVLNTKNCVFDSFILLFMCILILFKPKTRKNKNATI